MTDASRQSGRSSRSLRWSLALTRLGLVAERGARAFWPLWSLLLVSLGAVLLGLPVHLPIEALWSAMVAVVGGAVALSWRGVRRFRWPTAADAVARLDATLPGRPMAALADAQVIGAGDPGSEAVWAAHLVRMQARLAGARAVDPDLRLSRFDRYGLRYVALTVFVIALIFGSVWQVQSLAVLGPGGSRAALNGPVWEGWIEPPAYTGRPNLYLGDLTPGRIEVPVGSRISLRLYGQVGALTVNETVSARTGQVESVAETTQSFEVRQDGKLEISGPGGAVWEIRALPDTAPEITAEGPADRTANGEMKQAFSARDDYGVTAGSARIALDLARVDRRYGLAIEPEPRDAIEVDLPMPMTGNRTEYSETLTEDFSKHPFAGLPVTLTLRVEDAAGGVGQSAAVPLETLPGRRFFDPLANAIIEQRRDLLWNLDNAARVAQMLRAVSARPEGYFRSETDYLRIRFVARELEAALAAGAMSAAVRDESAEALWQLALRIEDGPLSDAKERLMRAQDRLSEAMKNGASDDEVAKLMQDLRDAMRDYLNQLAQQTDPDKQPSQDQQSQNVTPDQLQQMLDQIQKLMEEGRMAEAQKLLEAFNQMMQNMQVTQGQSGSGSSPGEQAMKGLSETLRQQQGLSDDGFQSLQNQFDQGGKPGEGAPGAEGSDGQGPSLADRQDALRETLRQQQEGLPGSSGEAGKAAREALDQAGRAMGEAEQALREEDLAGALDSQSKAMDALREGMQALGEDLAQNRQQGNGQGQGEGQAQQGSSRDPLGRNVGSNGQSATQGNMLPDHDEYRRARDLLDEIRRRSSEQGRPEIELDYLKRLLERF